MAPSSILALSIVFISSVTFAQRRIPLKHQIQGPNIDHTAEGNHLELKQQMQSLAMTTLEELCRKEFKSQLSPDGLRSDFWTGSPGDGGHALYLTQEADCLVGEISQLAWTKIIVAFLKQHAHPEQYRQYTLEGKALAYSMRRIRSEIRDTIFDLASAEALVELLNQGYDYKPTDPHWSGRDLTEESVVRAIGRSRAFTHTTVKLLVEIAAKIRGSYSYFAVRSLLDEPISPSILIPALKTLPENEEVWGFIAFILSSLAPEDWPNVVNSFDIDKLPYKFTKKWNFDNFSDIATFRTKSLTGAVTVRIKSKDSRLQIEMKNFICCGMSGLMSDDFRFERTFQTVSLPKIIKFDESEYSESVGRSYVSIYEISEDEITISEEGYLYTLKRVPNDRWDDRRP